MTVAGPFVRPAPEGAVTLVAPVAAAVGSRAAAAALACAGADQDRAGLLVDLCEGRAPRPGLIASRAARQLEERLAARLPDAAVASRGWLCRLVLPAERASLADLPGIAAIARGCAAVFHLPSPLLQPALEEDALSARGALLRADLAEDRALTALLARDLVGRSLRVAVLKRPLGWVASQRALAGALPRDAAGGLPGRLLRRLLVEADHGRPRPGLSPPTCGGW
jgi:hypothetical protein